MKIPAKNASFTKYLDWCYELIYDTSTDQNSDIYKLAQAYIGLMEVFIEFQETVEDYTLEQDDLKDYLKAAERELKKKRNF